MLAKLHMTVENLCWIVSDKAGISIKELIKEKTNGREKQDTKPKDDEIFDLDNCLKKIDGLIKFTRSIKD